MLGYDNLIFLTMDKLLKPKDLDIAPTDPDAPATFKYWLATFETFLEAVVASQRAVNPDAAVDRKALLINMLSPIVYPYVEDCQNYEDALDVLKRTFIKRKNDVFARHLLATRKQRIGESLEQFLQALKVLSKDSSFRAVNAEEYRQELLRDAFINGLFSSSIRQRLLERDDLTLQAAFEQAYSLYRAHEQSTSYNGSLSAAVSNDSTADAEEKLVNVLTKNSAEKRKCYFCGGYYHIRSRCPARNVDCLLCKKRGHFAKVCMSKTESKRKQLNSVASISASYIASTVGAPYCLDAAIVDVVVSNTPARALVDTGASESYVNKHFAQEMKFAIKGPRSSVALASTKSSVNVCGYIESEFVAFDQNYELRLGVVEDLCADLILGQNFLRLHKSTTFDTGGNRDPIMIKKAYKVCAVSAAKVEPPRLFQFLSDNVRPIATPSRRYNQDDLAFIKSEVQKLINDGVIEPSESPWRAQVLVTKSETHKRRMVVDYSQTINRFTELDAYPLPRIDEQINKLAQCKIFSTLDLKSAYHQVPLAKEDRTFTAFEADGKLYQFCRLPFGVKNGVSAFQRIIDKVVTENKLQNTYAYLDNITIGGQDKASHDKNLDEFLQAAKKRNLTFNQSKSVFAVPKINVLGYQVSEGQIRPDPDRLRPLLELPLPKNAKDLKRCLGMFSYYARWIRDFSRKIKLLSSNNVTFPLGKAETENFQKLRNELVDACLGCIDEQEPFTIECDASDFAIAAVLNQNGRPVAFMSRTLTNCECKYPTVEKEAASIIEAVRKWSHYLHSRPFTLVTDQRSLAFMFDQQNRGKIKNAKIQAWRIELGMFHYNIIHRPGRENVAPDTLSRVCSFISQDQPGSLRHLHEALGHPGVTRFWHFVRSKNLNFSLEEIRQFCLNCSVCCELKPRFHHPGQGKLIKATQAWERISIDFKGPVASSNKGNRYLLIIVDEFSRFPFAFPCRDLTTASITNCLSLLFSLVGFPSFVHSDRAATFMSREFKEYLNNRGIATSNSNPYHPTGNSQCERYVQTIWKTIALMIRGRKLSPSHWEDVLAEALHSVRTLLCTSTNTTPHERFFTFARRSMMGRSLPSWLVSPGPVLVKRFVRTKQQPLCEEVELLEANPNSALIRSADGRESSVSTSDLAPCGEKETTENCSDSERTVEFTPTVDPVDKNQNDNIDLEIETNKTPELRRSTRNRRVPDRYGDLVSH